MKIAVLGTGYVGLVTGACFSETGNTVVCVDIHPQKVAQLQKGEIPFYEPNLQELVKQNINEKRLTFSLDLAASLKDVECIFICVGTPSLPSGAADLQYVYQAARDIAQHASQGTLVITKSTVPVGTGDGVEKIFREAGRKDLVGASNPEFLREGSAVQDCLMPDRVVVGVENRAVETKFKTLYEPFLRTGNPLIFMDRRSAEMTKYTANALLASRISFINEMSRLCEKVGANVEQVREAVGHDNRIGMKYLFPSLGFGGSCFPKDVRALQALAIEHGLDPHMLKATLQSNEDQKLNFVKKIKTHFKNDLKGKKIAVWGAAFKAKTDDIRESPAITVVDELLKAGADICAYDPAAMDNLKKQYGTKISYAENAYQALEKAHALCVLTEWNRFRNPDFAHIKDLLLDPVIFDGRNLYSAKTLEGFGLRYIAIGS